MSASGPPLAEFRNSYRCLVKKREGQRRLSWDCTLILLWLGTLVPQILSYFPISEEKKKRNKKCWASIMSRLLSTYFIWRYFIFITFLAVWLHNAHASGEHIRLTEDKNFSQWIQSWDLDSELSDSKTERLTCCVLFYSQYPVRSPLPSVPVPQWLNACHGPQFLLEARFLTLHPVRGCSSPKYGSPCDYSELADGLHLRSPSFTCSICSQIPEICGLVCVMVSCMSQLGKAI